MGQRKGTIVLALLFIAVVCLELILHRFLATNALLRDLYLSGSKKNSITMIVDNFIPSVILGFAAGWVGYQWSIRKLCITAVLLALGIFASQSLYRLFFAHERLWWWPPHALDVVFWLVPSLIILTFFIYEGRIFRAWNTAGHPRR